MSVLKTLASVIVALSALATPALADKTIRVGVTAGEHEQVMEQVRIQAKARGLDIEIVPFSDYVLPNQALNDGDLDANSFQHEPYLRNQIKDRGYELTVVGKNFVTPMGVYSQKVKSLEDLKEGARIGIPNDPTNGGRALLLLQSRGLLTLKEGTGLTPGVLDIVDNPKKLKITEVDAAQLPRSLPDLDAAAINTNYALSADLNPTRDAIAIESKESPYANIIVVRTKDKDADWVKALVESYNSAPIRTYIEETFKGALIPVF